MGEREGRATRQVATFWKICFPHLLRFLASDCWFALESSGEAGREGFWALAWTHAVPDIREGSRLEGEMKTQPLDV